MCKNKSLQKHTYFFLPKSRTKIFISRKKTVEQSHVKNILFGINANKQKKLLLLI